MSGRHGQAHGSVGDGATPRRCAASRARSGQSLIEISLILPFVLIAILAAVSLGLALRAQTSLSQTTQQAAQYLLEHPTSKSASCTSTTITSAGAYHTCAEAIVDSYLQNHGFSSCSACATVSFGATKSGVLKDTIAISYAYGLPLPIPGRLWLGPLRGNTANLGVTVTTIAALPPIRIPTGASCTSGNACWTVYNPSSSQISFSYAVYDASKKLLLQQTTAQAIAAGGSSSQISVACSTTCTLYTTEADGLTGSTPW